MKRLICLCAMACLQTHADGLYLITGAPTPKGGDYVRAELWRVETDGHLTNLVELAADDEGLHRLNMVQEERKALLMTKFPKVRLAVLDFDTHSIIKSCAIPKGTYEWASVSPLRFNVYPYGEGIIRGVDLTPSLSCLESLRILSPAEYALPVDEGKAGVDQLAANEMVPTGIDAQGRIQRSFNGTTVFLGYSIPARFLKARQNPPNGALLANTSAVLAYKIAYPNEPSRILILHKPSGTLAEIPTANYAGLRAFGKFLVITDGHVRKESSSTLPAAQREVSPGAQEWHGGRAEYFFRTSIMVYGGALHVFDSETRTTRTIKTNQADSEVVLIDGKSIYYRISDRLYQATLSDNAIVDGKLLAKSVVIRDVHWAFLSK